MPSLFVTGEILGASGLSSTAGDSDLSLWTLIDFLALQSSTWHDYFCTWRLVLGPRSDIPGSNAEGGWQVLQGLTSGQTQLHHATMGGLGVSNLANTSTFECDTATSPTLDAVWAHPIDLHLACKSSFDEWPKLEFAVWSFDRHHCARLHGEASVTIPMATREYTFSLPIVMKRPRSLLGLLARYLGVPPATAATPTNLWVSKKKQKTTKERCAGPHELSAAGTIHLRLAVAPHGFQNSGMVIQDDNQLERTQPARGF